MSELRSVHVDAAGVRLEGDLALPEGALGLVLFAHGSGSSRHSTRNQHVATILQEAGLATLLFDLLTADEEQVDRVTREHRFDIPLLARRLVGAVDWVERQPQTAGLPVGLFGASTGAAASLIAAAERPARVGAVVSRGGRPDLADGALPHVTAPTLLLVGSLDHEVIALNEQAAARLEAPHRLVLIPGATHLFEEPGTLDQAAGRARDWFVAHLAG